MIGAGKLERYVMGRTLASVGAALAVIAAVIILVSFVNLSREVAVRADVGVAQLFGLTLLQAPSVVLLLLPFIPGLGTDAGADVWISIGGLFSFQPGELAKICLAIFFAGYLVRTREALSSVGRRFLGITWPRARDLGPLLKLLDRLEPEETQVGYTF